MKSQKISLYLNPDKDEHRRVLEYISQSEGSYTDAITKAVTAYLAQQEPVLGSRAFLQMVKETIAECLSNHSNGTVPLQSSTADLKADENDSIALEVLAGF